MQGEGCQLELRLPYQVLERCSRLGHKGNCSHACYQAQLLHGSTLSASMHMAACSIPCSQLAGAGLTEEERHSQAEGEARLVVPVGTSRAQPQSADLSCS